MVSPGRLLLRLVGLGWGCAHPPGRSGGGPDGGTRSSPCLCLTVSWASGGPAPPPRSRRVLCCCGRRGSGMSVRSHGLVVAFAASLHIRRLNVLFVGCD